MEPKDVVACMDKRYALFGFLFAFHNRLQAVGDKFYEEITCKQFFVLVCMNLFPDENPSLLELAQVMGCSHQNIKSIVIKLQEKGLIRLYTDQDDKRKQRVAFTEKSAQFAAKYETKEKEFMEKLYEGISDKKIAKTFDTLLRMEENLIEISNHL